MCFLLPWALWSLRHFLCSASGFLTWVFVLIPSLDCKLHEGRDWVLLMLSPFWLQSPNFSLGDNSFPTGCAAGGTVKVSCQKDVLSLEFEFWVMGHKDWQWLALIHPGQGALKESRSLVPASQIPEAALVPELSEALFFRFSFVSVSCLISL